MNNRVRDHQFREAFICPMETAPTKANTHTRARTTTSPKDLRGPAVICHLAANWAVSAGLLFASGLLVILPFEGRPIRFNGRQCQRVRHHCNLYGAVANLFRSKDTSNSERQIRQETGSKPRNITSSSSSIFLAAANTRSPFPLRTV